MEKVSEDVSINEYSEEPLLPSFWSSASNKFSVKIGMNFFISNNYCGGYI